MREYLLAIQQLLRPVNVVITFASVILGAAVLQVPVHWTQVIWAGLMAAAICGGGNVYNDLCDIAIDRVNKPWRPLPDGRISKGLALGLTVFLFAFPICFLWFFDRVLLIVAGGVIVLLLIYSRWLKRLPLWGNLVVSVAASLSFPFGALAASKQKIGVAPAVWYVTIFAFLFHLGRELLKDIEDLDGDRAVQARTFPLVYGIQPTRRVINFVFLFLIGFTFVPFFLHVFSWKYLVVVAGGVDLSLLYVLLSLHHDFSNVNLHRLSTLLKVNMLVGLGAIFLGTH